MQRKTKWIIGGALAGALVLGGVGTVAAEQARKDDQPLTGEQYDRATKAALDHTQGGRRVTETEMGDDGAAYEVEVMKEDGRQVEVNLDDQYRVTQSEPDDDANEADDDADDADPDDD